MITSNNDKPEKLEKITFVRLLQEFKKLVVDQPQSLRKKLNTLM